MLNTQYIRSLMTYFAGFVSADAINKLGKLPKNARLTGYDLLISELQEVPKKADTEISNYIFSINEKYLSDNVKTMSGKLLFVEYGNITLRGQVVTSSEVELAITVASEFTISNNDIINEALMMENNLATLNTILETMQQEQESLEACPAIKLLEFPATIIPVSPSTFFDHGGWCAMFTRKANVFS